MAKKSALDEDLDLPVKLDSATNGEYFPKPLEPRIQALRRELLAEAGDRAKRLGMSRREYLASASCSAAVFLALNQLGCAGGRYEVPGDAIRDPDAAASALVGDEFIFDVQTHHVSGERDWWATERPNLGTFLQKTPQARCGASHWAKCYTDDVYIREIFLDSDTDLAVISALWGEPNPILVEEAARTRERVAELHGDGRVMIHGGLYPNAQPFEKVREDMQEMVERWGIAAWKLYPVWGPEGRGYRLGGELGLKTIERGLELGIPIFAVHLGLPLAGMEPELSRPTDVGRVARAHPNAIFLIYHSGYEDDRIEGPYDRNAERGVDALIASLEKSGVGKNGNVYAELGSLWREVMKTPDQAAHVIGKLLVHLGEDRIVWGTDGIWYGSPQDQIQAFRTFEITPEFQERFGYPALTKERKAKIFGLNAARVYRVDPAAFEKQRQADAIARVKREYAGAPNPSNRTYGPRTRREMLGLLRWESYRS